MANVILKSDERKAYEQNIMRSFGAGNTSVSREAAEVIAARSTEAINQLDRMEGR